MTVADDKGPAGSSKRHAESATGRIGDDVQRAKENISEPLDRAGAGRVLPERNMSSYVIIIGDVFR